MVYRVIGVAINDTTDGIDIAFIELQAEAGKWSYSIINEKKNPFDPIIISHLKEAATYDGKSVAILNLQLGQHLATLIQHFIDENSLDFKIALIGLSGFILFYDSKQKLLSELGDGATIAAATKIPVVTNFYSMDCALGGQAMNQATVQNLLGSEAPATVLTAMMGTLRWRQEYNVFATDTGASRNSIGGTLWNGEEA